MQSQNKIHKATAASFHRPTPTTFSEPLDKPATFSLKSVAKEMSSGGLLAAVAFVFAVDTSAAATGAACQLHTNREFFTSPPTAFPRHFSLAALGRVKLISKPWFLLSFFSVAFQHSIFVFFGCGKKKISRPQRKLFIFNKRVSER